jgi:hypothetical protein
MFCICSPIVPKFSVATKNRQADPVSRNLRAHFQKVGQNRQMRLVNEFSLATITGFLSAVLHNLYSPALFPLIGPGSDDFSVERVSLEHECDT